MFQKIQKLAMFLPMLALGLLVGLQTHAQSTSTVITAVGTGFSQGADAAFQMVGDNIGIVMIVFGVLMGVGILMRLLKRGSRG